MMPRMKLLIGTAIFTVWVTGSPARAQQTSPLSPADFKKIVGLIDTVGTPDTFPAPMASNLGLSTDQKKDLPVTDIVTTDLKIYVCRSRLDPSDYIVWVIGADEKSSKMFVTHANLKLTRALYMRAEAAPQLQNVDDPATQADYQKALAALARDLQKKQGKTKK